VLMNEELGNPKSGRFLEQGEAIVLPTQRKGAVAGYALMRKTV